jgi:hypothetical protein
MLNYETLKLIRAKVVVQRILRVKFDLEQCNKWKKVSVEENSRKEDLRT